MNRRLAAILAALLLAGGLGISNPEAASASTYHQALNTWTPWMAHRDGCNWRALVAQVGSTPAAQLQVSTGCGSNSGVRVFANAGSGVFSTGGGCSFYALFVGPPPGCTPAGVRTIQNTIWGVAVVVNAKVQVCTRGNICAVHYVYPTGGPQ